jgi:hypothetical protein
MFLSIVLLISIAATWVYFNQDKVINWFVNSVNEKLATPVQAKSIELTFLDDFPNISIVCRDVRVEDSFEAKNDLLTAQSISFQLNLSDLWRGNYRIKGLTIKNANGNFLVDKRGRNNYTIFKESNSNTSSAFSLENIVLKSIELNWQDEKSNYTFNLVSDQLKAQLNARENITSILVAGDIYMDHLTIQQEKWLAKKDILVNAKLEYFDELQKFNWAQSEVTIDNAQFTTEGQYNWSGTPTIKLNVKGKETNWLTLVSILPEKFNSKLKSYQSEGQVYFEGKLEGKISETESPGLSLSFGLKHATLFEPSSNLKASKVNLEGSLASSSINRLSEYVLVLNNVEAELEEKPLTGKLILKNFDNPEIITDCRGTIPFAFLAGFLPGDTITQTEGFVEADIAFEGKWKDLQLRSTIRNTSARGSINLQNIAFNYGDRNVSFKNLNGNLQFNKNDLALSNVSLLLNENDILMNGFFKNALAFLALENQPVAIEADLKAKKLNLSELFNLLFTQEQTDDFRFSISKDLFLNFTCDVEQLNYKKFKGKNLKGDLLIKNQTAISRDLKVETMGGDLKLSAIMDATNSESIEVSAQTLLNNIKVDTLFDVFDNFNQDFLQAKHVEGRLTAQVDFEMSLTPTLKTKSETLIADVKANIKQGALKKFEPIQALNKYLDEDGLHHLKFAELKNDIHIENRTIYIPQMEITSNVAVLTLSGTHTFDQQIDYRVVAPLRNKRKINIDEAGSAIEEMEGRTKIFLKITGTTENYQVQYDATAVRKKLADDLKKEVKELKDAFKLKGEKKKKEIELTEEEFDWEN